MIRQGITRVGLIFRHADERLPGKYRLLCCLAIMPSCPCAVTRSKETKLFNPGIARKVFGKVDPKNPKTLIVETHTIDYKRQITVYIPAQYVAGSEAPFMVCHDGPTGKPNMQLPQILDNLIAQKRLPPIIAIMVANGGGDAQGH